MTGRDRVPAVLALLLVTPVALSACAESPRSVDGGSPDASLPPACTSDDACSDGRWCTGTERCDPGTTGADVRGCVRGAAPCDGSERCDESARRCLAVRCDVHDADGDGHWSIACGGDDCDDTDPERFPGNVEVCDAADRDEDCDPRTFGRRDLDGDGRADARCCNVDATGARHCGDDCDDSHSRVHPAAPEICNGIDDDCDGLVDEGVTIEVWPDLDGDGFGDRDAESSSVCYPQIGQSDRAGDCDDTNHAIHPAAPETCGEPAVDEDCDGEANPAWRCACSGVSVSTCALPGVCAAGVVRCFDGHLSECSILGSSEECDGVDQDCDGLVDEGTTIRCFADGDDDGYAAAGSQPVERCWASGRDERGGCPEGTTNRAPEPGAIDCDDVNPSARPGALELCDGSVDEDCDGLVDEGLRAECWPDADGDGFAAATATSAMVCSPPGAPCHVGQTPIAPTTPATVDCDDTDRLRAPTNAEVCNGRDDDCDLSVDEGLPLVARFVDADRDGWGGSTPVMACDGAPGTSPNDRDCDDAARDVNPGQGAWFTTPHCPAGGGPCSFDWNCDGVEERQPEVPADACVSALDCRFDGCPAVSGPSYSGGVPPCGGEAPRAKCDCLLSMGCVRLSVIESVVTVGCH